MARTGGLRAAVFDPPPAAQHLAQTASGGGLWDTVRGMKQYHDYGKRRVYRRPGRHRLLPPSRSYRNPVWS